MIWGDPQHITSWPSARVPPTAIPHQAPAAQALFATSTQGQAQGDSLRSSGSRRTVSMLLVSVQPLDLPRESPLVHDGTIGKRSVNTLGILGTQQHVQSMVGILTSKKMDLPINLWD